MTDLDQWRARLSTGRAQLREAEDLTARTRWALDQADGQLADARRLGEEALVERAERERAAAEREHAAAVEQLPGLRGRLMDGLVDVVDGLHDAIGVGGDHEVELDRRRPGGADRAVPGAAGDPLRRSGRGAGAAGADLPRRPPHRRPRARPEPGGGHLRTGRTGPPYALARRRPKPGRRCRRGSAPTARCGCASSSSPTDDAGAPTFPDVTLRAGGTSRPPVARALPDLFLVRVRAGGWSTTVPGRPSRTPSRSASTWPV